MATTVISAVQVKRGQKEKLINKLTAADLGVLLSGELCWETDTNQLKIGDGIHDYDELPYLTGDESVEDHRFLITDPLENQILLYDSTQKKWINKTLTDDESIVYLNDAGLTIKGYDTAKQGQMLVKDNEKGLAWVDPVSDIKLQTYVAQAQAAATQSSSYATIAGNNATEAAESATTAQTINNKTMEYVNNKFWWGTLSEYNALESINKDTFYYITAEE